ncbi:MAG: hemerythrin domain-containing protein [Gammaproteobacteria bacterium]|nr:hemerythrin domain-containing protein [Gammaproteobacteria bacterium]
MHRIMQILHEDHVNVARLLDVMDDELERARQGDLSDLNVMHHSMRYMTAYPDIYHHPTEEIVFERLATRAPETRAVIERLSGEHRTIGKSGTVFLETLQLSMEQPDVAEKLLELGPDYCDRLRQHMDTEEGKVFPMIKVVLSSHDWESLEQSIASAGDPLFGPQVQKSYQDLARALGHKTT